MTNYRGVDVILNSLAGESLKRSFECIAPLGRFIEVGKRDIHMGESLSMSPFLQSVTFASADLGVVADDAPALIAELMNTVISLGRAEPTKIHPPWPLNIFKVSQVEEAFRFFQTGKNAGKAVVELHTDDVVPVSSTYHFSTTMSNSGNYCLSVMIEYPQCEMYLVFGPRVDLRDMRRARWSWTKHCSMNDESRSQKHVAPASVGSTRQIRIKATKRTSTEWGECRGTYLRH